MRNKLLFLICFGFVSSSLVFAEAGAVYPPLKKSPPANKIARPQVRVPVQRNRATPFLLGATLGGDALLGQVENSTIFSKGLGYSVGLLAEWNFVRRFRASLSPTYQYQRLGRPIDGSGQLVNPSPANFDQSIRSMTVTFLGGFQLNTSEIGTESKTPAWWLNAGTQVLFPLSAEQTISDSSRSFTAEKNAYLLLGVSLEYPFDPHFTLEASLMGIGSLFGNSSGRLLGTRLLFSFKYVI